MLNPEEAAAIKDVAEQAMAQVEQTYDVDIYANTQKAIEGVKQVEGDSCYSTLRLGTRPRCTLFVHAPQWLCADAHTSCSYTRKPKPCLSLASAHTINTHAAIVDKIKDKIDAKANGDDKKKIAAAPDIIAEEICGMMQTKIDENAAKEKAKSTAEKDADKKKKEDAKTAEKAAAKKHTENCKAKTHYSELVQSFCCG